MPADAYYGVQTQRAVENFPISGLTAPAELVTATVLVKKAAAQANATLGRLPADIADAIVAAADEILGRRAPRSVRRRRLSGRRRHLAQHEHQRGAGQPRRRDPRRPRGDYTLVHPNDHVNMGQSTNDVFPTATRLAILLMLPRSAAAARALADGLDEKSARVRATC